MGQLRIISPSEAEGIIRAYLRRRHLLSQRSAWRVWIWLMTGLVLGLAIGGGLLR